MIYFIYGRDSYRAKRKLEEIIFGYKEKNKSGLSLLYINAEENSFKDFYSNLQINSMFAEKKLIVIKNLFSAQGGPASGWQEEFLDNIENLEGLKDIVVVYESEAPDQRTKFFKLLFKTAKCQEFDCLEPVMVKKWALQEFAGHSAKINSDALDLLVNYVRDDLWRMANEISKLSSYKKGSVITKEDVKLLVKPETGNDIFKTIEALVSGDKKYALSLLHKHLDDGEVPLYLLSMIAYQFKTLLIIKDLQDRKEPYATMAKKSGLHPFVIQKTYNLCSQFSMEKLKKIYHKIFQVDSDIKTGKIEAETALDLLVSEI